MDSAQLKRINMGFNYKLAEKIISCFNSDDISDRLNCLLRMQVLDDIQLINIIFEEQKQRFLKPNKFTLLHSFIREYLYNYIMNERCYFFDELCCDFEVDVIIEFISETVRIFKEYGIIISDFENIIDTLEDAYVKSDYADNTDCDESEEYINIVKKIYDEVLCNFEAIEEDIVEAVFYLLYSNKEFLLRFNQYLSSFTTVEYLDPSFFDNFKHIKRCKYLPEWLKRAVFYRDNGRCQHCGKDLSGLISINNDKELQFDHIVPLEHGGTNDATNFQLLCSPCNSQKGGKSYNPNYYYQMYW